jgi:hypothetical protein
MPPRGTRAWIRGQAVKRLSHEHALYRAEWTRIYDVQRRRILELGDPFESAERWTEMPSPAASIE